VDTEFDVSLREENILWKSSIKKVIRKIFECQREEGTIGQKQTKRILIC
jgi:hypothetical protein